MTVVFPYVKQTWTDGVSNCSAARNNVHEDGIFNAHNQPAVRVYHNTTQSHTTSSTEQVVIFNSERFDQAGGAASTQHDTVTNNSRLTCVYAGVYQISAHLCFAGNATGVRYVAIRHSVGPTRIAFSNIVSAAVDNNGRCAVTTLWPLAVNEYVEMLAWQSSGGALNIDSTLAPVEFMMVRVA